MVILSPHCLSIGVLAKQWATDPKRRVSKNCTVVAAIFLNNTVHNSTWHMYEPMRANLMTYLTVWRDDLVKKDSSTVFVLLGVPPATWMIFAGNKPLPLGSPKHSVSQKTYPTDYAIFVNTCTSEAVVTFNITLHTLTADQLRWLKLPCTSINIAQQYSTLFQCKHST
jgi:hypothetical protein